MRKKGKYGILLHLLACLLFCTGYVPGRAQSTFKTERILIILDASRNMQQPWGDSLNRYKAASTFIIQLMDSVYARNNEVEFALRAFGHQSSAALSDCYDTKFEVMYSMDNYAQMGLRLVSLRNKGNSPVAFAINEALDYDMPDEDRYNYHLVIITGDNESCGGNICALAKKMSLRYLTPPCVISVVNNAELKNAYSCLGSYQTITNKAGITNAIHNMLTGCCIVPPLIKRKIPGDDDVVNNKRQEERLISSEQIASMYMGNTLMPVRSAAPVLKIVKVPTVNIQPEYEQVSRDTIGSLKIYKTKELPNTYAINSPAVKTTDIPSVSFKELPKPLNRDTISYAQQAGNKYITNSYTIAAPQISTKEIPEVRFKELSTPLTRDTFAYISPANNRHIANNYTINTPVINATNVPEVSFKALEEPLTHDTIAGLRSYGNKQIANTYSVNSPVVKTTNIPAVNFKELVQPLGHDTIASVQPSNHKPQMVAYTIDGPAVKPAKVPEVSFKELYTPINKDTIAAVSFAKSKTAIPAGTVSSPSLKPVVVAQVRFKELAEPLAKDTVARVSTSKNKQIAIANTVSAPAVKTTEIPKVNFKELTQPLPTDTLHTLTLLNKKYGAATLAKPAATPVKVPKVTVATHKPTVSDTVNLVKINNDPAIYSRDNLKSGVIVHQATRTAPKTGYLKVLNHDYTGRITFYFQTNGQYQYFLELKIDVANVDQRFKLIEGKYKITYNNNDDVREFTIAPSKMAGVSL